MNCHHTIWHSDKLSINNVKALYNNFNDSLDTDYAEFLTMYDGEVDIINSVFDIDFDISYLCENEINIKFAQSLIGLGEETILNTIPSEKLNGNDTLPLFQYPYNNTSHVYIKYYYPSIEACVVISPKLNKESFSANHHILGIDWVFKNNVNISRLDSNNDNSIRKINWDDFNVF